MIYVKFFSADADYAHMLFSVVMENHNRGGSLVYAFRVSYEAAVAVIWWETWRKWWIWWATVGNNFQKMSKNFQVFQEIFRLEFCVKSWKKFPIFSKKFTKTSRIFWNLSKIPKTSKILQKISKKIQALVYQDYWHAECRWCRNRIFRSRLW